MSGRASSHCCRESFGRERISLPDLLVFPPAELRSGGADVHAARPRPARTDPGDRLDQLHLAVLLPHHRPIRCPDRTHHAEGRGSGGALVVRRRLAVLAARRPALPVPAARRSATHELRLPWIAPSITSPSLSSE